MEYTNKYTNEIAGFPRPPGLCLLIRPFNLEFYRQFLRFAVTLYTVKCLQNRSVELNNGDFEVIRKRPPLPATSTPV